MQLVRNGFIVAAAVVSIPILIVTFFVLEFTGAVKFYKPVAEFKLMRLEHSIYRGEPKQILDDTSGREWPVAHAPEENADVYVYPEWYTFCVVNYIGLKVHFDRHSRVKSWERMSTSDGC